MVKRKKRVQSLDAIKGISIIAIILYHLFPDVVPGGFLTVNTFLVLAGYFFIRKFESIIDSTENFSARLKESWTYFKKTFSRLFLPLFWMIMIVVVFLYLFDQQQLNYIQNDIFSSLFFVNNIFQLGADRSYFVQMTNASPFTHLWYNSIYLQSFIIGLAVNVVLAFFKASKKGKAFVWMLLAFGSYLLLGLVFEFDSDPSRVYYGIDVRFSSFAIGGVLAYAQPFIDRQFKRLTSTNYINDIVTLVVGLIMLYLVFKVSDQSAQAYLTWMPVYNTLTVLFIYYLSLDSPFANALLENNLLVNIGKRSYTYYLWYYPVIVFFMNQFRFFNGQVWLINILSIVAIILIGELMYQLVEVKKWPIWFGTQFSFAENWQQFKRIATRFNISSGKLWRFIGYLGLVGLFIFGLFETDNDMPLAQFELEYQLYQTKPNLQATPYPGEGVIIDVKENLGYIDDTLETAVIDQPELEDPIETLQYNAIYDDPAQEELAEAISVNSEVLNYVEETLPITFDLLESEEIMFATELPMTFFGDSIALLSGNTVTDLFVQGNYFGYASLQIWDAFDLFETHIENGEVHENLVIVLGTNAGLDQEAVDQLIELAGDRQIFMVNTNSKVQHIQEVNDIVAYTSETYDNVYEIDWYSLTNAEPGLISGDDIHHSEKGMQYFTALLAREMYQVLN